MVGLLFSVQSEASYQNDRHSYDCTNEVKTPGVTPYNGLCEGASPEWGTFFRLEVNKRVGISRTEV